MLTAAVTPPRPDRAVPAALMRHRGARRARQVRTSRGATPGREPENRRLPQVNTRPAGTSPPCGRSATSRRHLRGS